VTIGKFERTIAVAADRERAWQVLTDVEELVTWVGIVHTVTELERLKAYSAILEDRMGPFNLRADLSIAVDIVKEGSAVRVQASGRDRSINSKIDIEGDLSLSSQASGQVEITVRGSYEVTGRIATMGAGVVRKKSDTAVEQFFSGIERVLGNQGQQ